MRYWAGATALLTGFFALGLFVYAPSLGHFVGGVFVGLPTILIISALISLPRSPKNDRRVLFLQSIATVTAAAVEVIQHLPVANRVSAVLLMVVPLAGAAVQIRRSSRSMGNPIPGNEEESRAS